MSGIGARGGARRAAWACLALALAGCGGGSGGGATPEETLPASYPGKRIVFVTSQAGDGNLIGWRPRCTGRSTGLEAADCICAEHATLWGGLSGTYRAWLSDSSQSAADRLAHATVPYVNRRGEEIAASWEGLLTVPCTGLLDYDEAGTPAASIGLVWTGSESSGALGDPAQTCEDWTSGGAGRLGRVGSPKVDPYRPNFPGCWSEWIEGGGPRGCDDQNRLYCVEQ